MGWFDDTLGYFKDVFKYDLPVLPGNVLGGGLSIPGYYTPREAAKGYGALAAALPVGALAGKVLGGAPGLAAGIGRPPIPVHTPTFAPSTPTDRPRPSMLDAVVPGTRRRTAYGTLTRGKTLGQLFKETAIREGTRELKTRLKRRKSSRTGGALPRRRKSRPRATSGESVLDYEPPKKRRRSTKPPSRKQLAARRRFAEMARARARSRRR